MPRSGGPSVVVVDNYDSFTFNLVQYLLAEGARCTVVESDRVSVADVRALAPRGVLISPGPGAPEHAGCSVELLQRLGPELPMLGVCLGHQALALAFGGRVRRGRPTHGKVSPVLHDGRGVLRGLPSPFAATRYHSLVVESDGLPDELEVTARTPSGEIMGLRHRRYHLESVQFHPESILTEHGPQLVQNWLSSI